MAHNRSNNTPAEPPTDFQKLVLLVMGVILPPLPVFLLQGNTIFTMEFLVSVLLTVLGHLPGVLFAVYYICVKYPQSTREEGYIRIDDENQVGFQDTPSDEPHSRQHFGIDDVDHGKSDAKPESAGEQAPPDYDEIVGTSNIAPLTDTKDNKVQN